MHGSEPIAKAAAGRVARRWLYLGHRWIGIATCLLFAMWFLSGLVMIYVPYPSLTDAERTARLEPIRWADVTAPAPDGSGLRSLTLEMRDGKPVWRTKPWTGEAEIISATAGQSVPAVTAAMAERAARRFGGAAVASIHSLERDQWTVAQRFDRHRPLWKIALADPAGTEIYVSSRTGDVAQNTTRSERFWNWLGSVPHWLYFTALRQDGALWRQVILWVAGPCVATGVTGFWIGLLRARLGRRRYKGGRITPYRGWMLWHHIAGLAGGIFLIAWIFSGWLSVDPGHLFRSEGIAEKNQRDYLGTLSIPSNAFGIVGKRMPGAVQITAMPSPGHETLMVAMDRQGRHALINGRTLRAFNTSSAILTHAAARLLPGASIASTQMIKQPDAYWYGTDELTDFPVLRIMFNDPARTWVHLDLRTGELLGSVDARGRLYRWLFDMLHKWDLNILTYHRPSWDALLWILSLPGLTISVSGVWIGTKRLRSTGVVRPVDAHNYSPARVKERCSEGVLEERNSPIAC
ncbi:MAG TPA: hypothetical protein VJM34_15385 [Novosphingobium sp.]|nr:hypothetical protein [Novosphingobium sp.]